RGKIEGDDRRHDSERLANQDLVDAARDVLDVVSHRQRRKATGDLDVLDAATQLGARLANRLPGLERNGACNLLELLFEQVPQLEQVCGALEHRCRAPAVERAI